MFVGIVAALLLLVMAVVPALADTATSLSVDLSPSDFVSNSSTAGNTVTITVHDPSNKGAAGLTASVKNLSRDTSTNTISVSLSEVGASTGHFTASFKVVSTSTSDVADEVRGLDTDSIQVVYAQRSASVTVDAKGPKLTNSSPSHDTYTKASTVQIAVDVSDDGSGVGSKDTDVKPRATLTVNSSNLGNPDTATDQGSGVWRLVWNLALSEGVHNWNVTMTDKAGNSTTNDRDTTTGGVDAFTINVDKTSPELSSAKTGRSWDADKKEIKKNVRNSIMVIFGKEGALTTADFLDASSLAPGDFVVDGATPTAVVFPNLKAGATGNAADVDENSTTGDETRHVVFLTLSSDLAPDATPTVEVRAGSVSDLAGNSTGAKSLKATDGIAPKLSVSITGQTASRPISTGKTDEGVTVTVTSDEKINGQVSFNYNKPVWDTTDAQLEAGAVTTRNKDAKDTTSKLYEDTVVSANVGSVTGLISVYVTGSDAAGNQGSSGSGSAAAKAVDLTKANLFEFDQNLTAPTFDLRPKSGGSNAKTESANPFLRLDYSEGAEYNINGNDKLDFGTPPTSVEIDSHNKVTITKITLNGNDVSGLVGSADDDSFILALSGLATGTYTVLVTAQDAVGNKRTDDKHVFEVVSRSKYKVSLNPGWNLVSIPGTPSDPAIDSVLPSSHPATTVLTYEKGVWKIATRGSDGKWTGSLSQIDGQHAYWINTPSFDSLSVLIPEPDASTLLPTVQLTKGWNLLPAVDIQQSKEGTDLADADVYLAGVDWSVLYSFNTSTNAWTRVVNKNSSTLDLAEIEAGKGYWVWLNKDGTLVP